MSRISSRLLTTLSAIALLALPNAASAEVWGGREPVGDAHGWTYSPDPAPCGTFADVAPPEGFGTDITRLGVKHNQRTVKVKVTLADVDEASDLHVTVHLRTPEKDWFVDVDRWDGHVRAFLAREPDWERLSQGADECGGISVMIGERPCERLSGAVDPSLDTVRVVVPRPCLRSPDWVRVGADTYTFGSEAEPNFHDTWAPVGTEEADFVGPYGPRVESGPALGVLPPISRVDHSKGLHRTYLLVGGRVAVAQP